MPHPVPTVLVLIGLLVVPGGMGCERAAVAPAPRASVGATAVARDACRLLSEAEAGVFLGGAATATPSDKLPFASSCIWEAHNPRRGLVVMTSTPAQLAGNESLRKADVDTIDKRFAQLLRVHLADGKGTPVAGLGDAALWVNEPAELWIVKKDAALVGISFHGQQASPDSLEKAKAVATSIIARL